MTNRRDIVLLVGLLAAMVLFVALGPGGGEPAQGDVPSTHVSAPGGALALYEWTRAMGYDAQRLQYRDFALSDEDDALVLLSPSEPVSREEARATLEWVARGGTLILADDTSAFGARNALLDELRVDVEVSGSTAMIDVAAPLQPVLAQPPTGELVARAGRVLVPRRDDVVPLVGGAGTGEPLVVAGIRHGQGYVFVSSSAWPLSNEGLAEPGNAALALNMLRRVPTGGRVQFDEVHHGYLTPPSTTTALLSTPWGWAGLYAVAVAAAYLALSGRRFGRPVALPEETARRTSAEYVESMANLFQRGGKRAYIVGHYRDALKRRLARPYGISPRLEDEAFVRELARAREVDEARLLTLLARLRTAPPDDDALLRAVAEADAEPVSRES
ncbi:MAG: hypothetical protein RLZZ387_4318 [Chloroflexota bacterium]